MTEQSYTPEIARTRGLTQEEQDAIWNDTQDCLRDIASSCRARAGSWTEVARKADKVLWLISGTNESLSTHPGKNADDGSTERLYDVPHRSPCSILIPFSGISWFVRRHGADTMLTRITDKANGAIPGN